MQPTLLAVGPAWRDSPSAHVADFDERIGLLDQERFTAAILTRTLRGTWARPSGNIDPTPSHYLKRNERMTPRAAGRDDTGKSCTHICTAGSHRPSSTTALKGQQRNRPDPEVTASPSARRPASNVEQDDTVVMTSGGITGRTTFGPRECKRNPQGSWLSHPTHRRLSVPVEN